MSTGDSAKKERVQKAYETQDIVERLKRGSGVKPYQPGAPYRGPYKRDDAGKPKKEFTGRAPESGAHNQ